MLVSFQYCNGSMGLLAVVVLGMSESARKKPKPFLSNFAEILWHHSMLRFAGSIFFHIIIEIGASDVELSLM